MYIDKFVFKQKAFRTNIVHTSGYCSKECRTLSLKHVHIYRKSHRIRYTHQQLQIITQNTATVHIYFEQTFLNGKETGFSKIIVSKNTNIKGKIDQSFMLILWHYLYFVYSV